MTGSSPLTPSPSTTLTYLLFSIAPLAVAPPLTSLLLSPLLLLGDASGPGFSSPTNCTICPSFSGLLPQQTFPFISPNFQKARWDHFAYCFDSHCLSAEEYSSLSLSSASALFNSLTLNTAKSSIPFGHIKRHPKAWWSAEEKEVVSKRRKAFAAAHRSDEDRQAYISTSQCASSVIAKAKAEHGRQLALLSRPNQILNLCTLSFVLSLALLPYLPPQTSPTVLLPGSRHRSSPIT